MKVYRISRKKFANDLTGVGSRLHGGRWNHKGVPVLYTSDSRALAIIEYSVNVNLSDIPKTLSLITLEINDDIEIIEPSDLPGNWRAFPAPAETKDYGSKLLKSAKNSIIRIPSVVIPEECNYLLNPLHKRSDEFKVIKIEDFVYDVRIKPV